MPFRSGDADLPLTPIDFELLLALAPGALHGYAILQAVEQRVGGRLPLRTGTLYRALARLLATGVIEETAAPDAAYDDERRRYYQLTTKGRELARAEAARLADLVAAARRHDLLPREGQR